MLALGVVFHKGAYLRSGWNVLDFIIVVSAAASLLLPNNKVSAGLVCLFS